MNASKKKSSIVICLLQTQLQQDSLRVTDISKPFHIEGKYIKSWKQTILLKENLILILKTIRTALKVYFKKLGSESKKHFTNHPDIVKLPIIQYSIYNRNYVSKSTYTYIVLTVEPFDSAYLPQKIQFFDYFVGFNSRFSLSIIQISLNAL